MAVLTYQRPVELAALLAALAALDDPPVVLPLPVYVVDNDADGSAASTVDAARRRLGESISYVAEPRPGIARARNAALDAARAGGHDVVVFIDDDELPDPGWLVELLRVAQEHAADGVAGPVVTEFDREPSRALSRGGFFSRARHPTGTTVAAAASNNLLLRLAAVDRLALPRFDVDRFNLTGGEDTDLTSRLTRAGCRIVWADEAVVRERLPAGRISWRWAVQRAYRTGNTSGRLIVLTGHPLVGWLQCTFEGSSRVIGGLAAVLLRALPGVPGHWATGLRTAIRGAGFLSAAAGRQHEEYRRSKGPP